jgi:hypothetical protein
MPTLQQASYAFNATRAFFGQPGAVKSNNKRYVHDSLGQDGAATDLAAETHIGLGAALAKVQRRDANAKLAFSSGTFKDILKGWTPVTYGGLTVNKGAPTGNCGVMACVAMYFAQKAGVPPEQMYLVEAFNRTTVRTGLMKFGHAWAVLRGANARQDYVLDPWAGVFSQYAFYFQDLKIALDKWQRQGKRVLVNYKEGDWWTNANDSAILSLFGPGATVEIVRGDGFKDAHP